MHHMDLCTFCRHKRVTRKTDPNTDLTLPTDTILVVLLSRKDRDRAFLPSWSLISDTTNAERYPISTVVFTFHRTCIINASQGIIYRSRTCTYIPQRNCNSVSLKLRFQSLLRVKWWFVNTWYTNVTHWQFSDFDVSVCSWEIENAWKNNPRTKSMRRTHVCWILFHCYDMSANTRWIFVRIIVSSYFRNYARNFCTRLGQLRN